MAKVDYSMPRFILRVSERNLIYKNNNSTAFKVGNNLPQERNKEANKRML